LSVLPATGWQTRHRLDNILVEANRGVCLLSYDRLIENKCQISEVYNLVLTILKSRNLVYTMSEKYFNNSHNNYLFFACLYRRLFKSYPSYLYVVTFLIIRNEHQAFVNARVIRT